MFTNLLNKLKEQNIEYDIFNEGDEETVSFGIMLCNGTIPCEFTYNKVDELVKFYTEIIEFEEDAAKDGLELANDINFNSVFLKAYMNDENVLVAEYYSDARIGLPEELIDDILGDIGNAEEFVEQYI